MAQFHSEDLACISYCYRWYSDRCCKNITAAQPCEEIHSDHHECAAYNAAAAERTSHVPNLARAKFHQRRRNVMIAFLLVSVRTASAVFF